MVNKILLDNLCEERLQEIKSYLESPTRNGIWKLDVSWNRDNKFHTMINTISDDLIDRMNKSDVGYIVLDVGKRRVRVESSKLLVDLPVVVNKISLIYAIFFNIAAEELDLEGDILLSLPNVNAITEFVIERGTELFNENKDEFKEPYELFKSQLLCENFIPRLHRFLPNRIKNGYYNVAGEQTQTPSNRVQQDSFTLHSQSKLPLKALEDFFKALKATKESHISMVFSPEEEVFQDYVKYVDFSKDKLFKQKNINNLLTRAISHHNEQNYLECVSNVGLIAEDLLTQVYETLFREPVLKGLTIGQLNDTINSKVLDLYPNSKAVEQPEIKPLFQDIKDVISSESPTVSESLVVMRKMLSYISDQNKFMTYKVESGLKKPKPRSIYSKDIIESIGELLKYRNAASHRSKIPIGEYEAIRSLYCSVKFYLWWEQEKLKIDWQNDKEEIIRSIVARYA